jgi:hypothetical protein
MSQARLRIVGQADTAAPDAASPESELTRLFAEQDRLELALNKVRTALTVERSRYAAKHGFRIHPGLDALRRTFGPRVGRH